MLEGHTVTIDTYAVIEALRADNKFTKEQAKAIVDTIRSVELYGVATSMQLQHVMEELKDPRRTSVQNSELPARTCDNL